MSSNSDRRLAAPTVHGPPRVGVAGMWTFLATDAMGFGGLFIAYGVLRVRADAWPDPRAHLGLGAGGGDDVRHFWPRPSR